MCVCRAGVNHVGMKSEQKSGRGGEIVKNEVLQLRYLGKLVR